MPTLTWTGKDKVINHHQEVPFHVLEHQYGFNAFTGQTTQETASGNKIIHGDNLLALKSLLPEYEGRIKCIYIDPPYNTGNEGWVYNDNVNDPKIKKWLGEVVGREGEDLNRHDKWLCMMYPRLQLLSKLLAPDGIIFVNLDDTESAHCRILLDEIFGQLNFLSVIAWEKRYTRSNNAKLFYSLKDTILVYRKSNVVSLLKEGRTEKADSLYTNPDNDPRGPWMTSSYINPATKEKRPNLVYNIINPNNDEIINHPTHAWKYSYDEHLRHVSEKRLWWGINGDATYPRLKLFLSENSTGMVPVDIWKYQESGTTDEGSTELKTIFKGLVFDNPKPTKLILRVLKLAASDPNAIILDSFAGSGTTAHAVLNLNKQDGGNRKFILIEMEDYAETITAERVRRVMKGYGNVEGAGEKFDYYELGSSLLDAEGNINEAVPVETIRNYVFYTETRLPLVKKTQSDNPYFLEKWNDTGYYFYYEKDRITVLDMEFLAALDVAAEQHLIYADQCLLEKDFLANNRIIFKKIPRDITRF